jgi:para-nitrobenzyl esterase
LPAGRSCAFLGIPYASAPLGALRFRAPRAPAPSIQSYGSSFGAPCPQISGDGTIVGSEDCLWLNVWTPGPPSKFASGRPVFVFLHGGGNVGGSSAAPEHDGRDLAALGDLVVVSVEFRLGALGYLAHPSLSSEADPEGGQPNSGNYGLLDQIAALEWVRDNIAHLGGDPARVLVLGQSAGARNLCALLAAPRADGLLSAAALHSGACNLRTLAEQEALGESVARVAGCENLTDVAGCLRGLDFERLIRALPGTPGPLAASEHNPNIDGRLVQASPVEAMSDGRHARVPLIVSTTQDEVGSVMPRVLTPEQYPVILEALFGSERAGLILARYPASEYDSPYHALVRLVTDARYACPARQTARAATSGGSTVYRAVFAKALERAPQSAQGAYHALDLLFLFRGFKRSGYAPSARELELANSMISYYARLAATGDPNRAGDEPWPIYDALTDAHFRFDDAPHAASGVSPHCDFWDGL